MKLLIVTDHSFIRYSSGVFDTFCFDRVFFNDYCQVFDSLEVLSRISDRDDIPSGAARSDGAGVSFIPIQDLHGLKWILQAKKVSQSLLYNAIDRASAVIVRVPGQLGWFAARRAKQVGKPYMVEVTGDPKGAIENANEGLPYKFLARLEAWRLRELVRNASVASYVNSNHLEKLYPVSPGTPRDSISSIRLDINSITQPRVFAHCPATLHILFVASLFRYKRHIDILRACYILLNQGIDFEVHFAGDGPMHQELETLAERLNIGEKTIFHGHVADRNSLYQLIDSSDLFVMSSASEGLPRAMLEAMARGLPVVGAKIPGVEELTRPSELYPVGDFKALALLLNTLSGSEERLNEMSWHSIETARQFTVDKLSPKRTGLYKELREIASLAQKMRNLSKTNIKQSS